MQFLIVAAIALAGLGLVIASARQLYMLKAGMGWAILAGVVGAVIGAVLGFMALFASLAEDPTRPHPPQDHLVTEAINGLLYGAPAGALFGVGIAVRIVAVIASRRHKPPS